MSVAEAIVIFPPMSQVGWARASSTSTSCSCSRLFPRNGPPEAVSTRRSTVPADSPRSSWKSAECSESTGITFARVPSASAVTSSPPITRLSLLASARSIPSARVATVGARPADPTTAFSTRSAPDSPTSRSTPSGPDSTSPPLHASCAGAAASGSATATRCTPCSTACASRRSHCSAADSPTTSSSSLRFTTSSACRPTEPVAPRITNLRIPAESRDAATAARQKGASRLEGGDRCYASQECITPATSIQPTRDRRNACPSPPTGDIRASIGPASTAAARCRSPRVATRAIALRSAVRPPTAPESGFPRDLPPGPRCNA